MRPEGEVMAEHAPVVAGAYSYSGKVNFIFSDGPRAPRAQLRIGRFSAIADGLTVLLAGEHNTDWVSTFPFGEVGLSEPIAGHPKSNGDIVVGNDVWVGMHVTLLSGAVIGDGAVIAAGSYVRGHVPPYSIYGGNPARLLTMRFKPELVERLKRIAWWDWSEERIRKAVPLLCQPDVAAFCDAVEDGVI